MSKPSLAAGRLSGNKEINSVVTLASSIVHELKNYLATIGVCTELSENRLKEINNICTKLSEGEIKNIKQSLRDADYLIQTLQLQIKSVTTGKLDTAGFKKCSMGETIKEALKQYPFGIGEKELITIKTQNDFEYNGDLILTCHILYNLIKNSLRAIKTAGKGKITIELESGEKFNKLIFRDTATGIPKDFLPKMFNLFSSQMTTQGGIGIGLAFCKLVMNSYGGGIFCYSVEGEYTRFMLKFPGIN